MATYLPSRLFDVKPAEFAAPAATEEAPATRAGSPVADDFSDLFPAPGTPREAPWMDDFRELLP